MIVWQIKLPIYLLAKMLKKQETDDIVKKRKELVKKLLCGKESNIKVEAEADGDSIGEFQNIRPEVVHPLKAKLHKLLRKSIHLLPGNIPC